MSQNEPYLYPMSTIARASNAVLLVGGMLFLFFETSVVLITGPSIWQYLPQSQIETAVAGSLVFFGIAGALLYFWWETRPAEGDG